MTTIANAINSFVSAYNSAQSLIATDMYVDPSDSTQDGPLASDTNLTFLASQLRSDHRRVDQPDGNGPHAQRPRC